MLSDTHQLRDTPITVADNIAGMHTFPIIEFSIIIIHGGVQQFYHRHRRLLIITVSLLVFPIFLACRYLFT